MTTKSLSLPGGEFVGRSLDATRQTENAELLPLDRDLIALVQKGDEEAFRELFARYYVLVRSIPRRMLKNPEDAEDVIQEAFTDFLQRSKTFDESKGTFKNWICYLAYHRTIKKLRYLKNAECECINPDEISTVLDADSFPDQWIRSLDLRRGLDVVLSSLSEGQRLTIELHYFKGLETDEIAAQLGEAIGNVYNHLYRGISKLRSELIRNGLLEGYMEFENGKKRRKVAH